MPCRTTFIVHVYWYQKSRLSLFVDALDRFPLLYVLVCHLYIGLLADSSLATCINGTEKPIHRAGVDPPLRMTPVTGSHWVSGPGAGSVLCSMLSGGVGGCWWTGMGRTVAGEVSTLLFVGRVKGGAFLFHKVRDWAYSLPVEMAFFLLECRRVCLSAGRGLHSHSILTRTGTCTGSWVWAGTAPSSPYRTYVSMPPNWSWDSTYLL